jgi:PKD repeat protein
MWGLSPSDNNAQINTYKAQNGITNPCAGTQGGAPAAIEIVIEGQPFLGYPTYCLVCPDKSMYFDPCYPPTTACFYPLIEDCAATSLNAQFSVPSTLVCEENPVGFIDLSTGNIISWEWTFEGGDPATSNEQNPEVIYHSAGYYDVYLTVSNGTTSDTKMREDYMHVDPCAGLGDLNESGLRIYPNPVSSEMNLSFQAEGETLIRIFDLPGTEMFRKKINLSGDFSTTISCEKFPAGIYFLIVQSQTKYLVQKINILR